VPLSDEARFARQRLVPEVGDEGQARLCAATFTLDALGPEAAAVARLYLERAGLRETEESAPGGPSEGPVAAGLSGARFAVRAIRDALESP
jgi:hypothetical protein